MRAAPPSPGFLTALLRMFTLQAGWNYERMVGIGFGFAIEPLLRSLPGGTQGAAYHRALARESEFFNAHPYLASIAVGALARAEVDGEPPEEIVRLRTALCGPLGSLGDRLVWAGWLPACAAAGILLAALGARGWAVVAFLLLYNVVHVGLRVWGLRAGWRHGRHVADALTSPGLKRGLRLVGPIAAFSVGAALPVAFGWQLELAGASAGTALGTLLMVAVVVWLGWRARSRVSPLLIGALLLGAAGLAGVLWP